MYKRIEELYKKQSPYNRIKKKFFLTYIGIGIILLLLNITDSSLMMFLTAIITMFVIKRICEKELKTKLYFKFDKKDKKGKPLDEIIIEKEKEIFQNYLKENKIQNYKSLKCIIEHYRNLVKPKVITDNLWSIISIVISIIIAFVTKDGFDFKSFEKTLPYLISFTFIVFIILFFVRKFSEIRTFLKGEEGIYERLEVIFSELYIDSLKENINTKNKNCKQKVKIKHTNKIKNKKKKTNAK